MCGIAGIVNKKARLSPSELGGLAKAMADRMPYRGPDDSGVWVDPQGYCAFSHRRLSIIDTSSAGHQPMTSRSGGCALTFNGEIYNFQDVRDELERAGEVFHTKSDTEVLLTALSSWGVDALPKLDGMFGFGFYDAQKRELILARDAFGEKPLYYVETNDYFAFASELHALTVLPDFPAQIDIEAIAAYLAFQYVPSPHSIYRAVHKLPPGCWLRLRSGQPPEICAHFVFRTSGTMASRRSLDDLADELESILVTSLRRRMISDVPLGAFLSGGVDSSTVAALATKKLGATLQTFSIGFAGQADSEHFDAREIAQHLGTDHRDQVLEGYPVELGQHIATVLDEPNGDSSCLPTYLLSRFARETVTVALSGDGGDEMFGGYGRYFVTVDEWARKRSGDRSLDWWNAGDAYYASRMLVYPSDSIKQLLGSIPPGLGARIAGLKHALDSDGRPLINALRETDASNYLPGAVLAKVDRMSMQHSLEVRAPLLGLDVAKFAMGLAADDCYGEGQGKLVLKRLASRYLPENWLRRPKRGFGIPTTLWDADTLLPATRELLLSRDSRLTAWIDRARLVAYLDRLESNFSAYQTWCLFILEIWLRKHPAIPLRDVQLMHQSAH